MPVLYPGSLIYSSTAGTTAGTGSWYTIPTEYGDLTWQAILTASSVGATGGSTVTIQLSNSTLVAAVTGQTIALTCTTDTVSNGGSPAGTTLDGAWKYIRAVLTSLTTSTAGSAGSPAVSVYAYAGKRN